MNHYKVNFMRLGMEPPRPFGKTSMVVCAATRDEAKSKVPASPGYRITASKTDQPVSRLVQYCSCTHSDLVESSGREMLREFQKDLKG